MALVSLEFTRKSFESGRIFGETGEYEQFDGTARFAIDPRHAYNKVVTDLDLAPRDGSGRVHFSADFSLVRPVCPERGNRRLLVDLPNRGRKVAFLVFDTHPNPMSENPDSFVGEGWLLEQGYTVLWCGWQHDVPESQGPLRAYVPEALEDGKPVTGRIQVAFQPTTKTQAVMLSDRGHVPYPSASVDDPSATLLVREYSGGQPRTVPRDQWAFARLQDGDEIPDPAHVFYRDGFQPGKRYELIYTGEGAPLTGLGLTGVRDITSFLRYASSEEDNPCAGEVDFAYACGASQSGAALRHLLYLGLHEDEQERMVFDGMLSHVAGARRSGANWRFGQPSPFEPPTVAQLFPFTDMVQTEPTTGHNDGLQKLAKARGSSPKVVYTNSSAEYWISQAALTHTSLDGEDVTVPDNVRIYHLAGTQHFGVPLPLTTVSPSDGLKSCYPFNCVDYRPLLRASLVNLDRWASSGTPPPPSRYPSEGDGTAIDREALRDSFPKIPGVTLPENLTPVARYDFGPDVAHGRTTQLPPKIGTPYPALVSSVDADGNEVSGIRLPDVAVPLATYTGWNLRHREIGGEGQILYLVGATLLFPRTASERRAKGDPRASIEERYPSKEAYLEKVLLAAKELAAEGYILESDVEPILQESSRRYDTFTQ